MELANQVVNGLARPPPRTTPCTGRRAHIFGPVSPAVRALKTRPKAGSGYRHRRDRLTSNGDEIYANDVMNPGLST